jgi:sialate O-acetylesterase
MRKLATPAGPVANDAPTLGHNGLIAPLHGLAVRGVLWYQGEENAGRAAAYAGGFQRLIEDWRGQFGDLDLPFLFVQLAAWLPPAENRPGAGNWAELRESQAAALALPHTGMATAIDVGDANDIHPRNKRILASAWPRWRCMNSACVPRRPPARACWATRSAAASSSCASATWPAACARPAPASR